MRQPGRELFRFCACCPAPCRSAIGAADAAASESETPSGLSLIALAVIGGQIAPDEATLAALRRTKAAHQCAPACPYGHDIATAIEAFAAGLDRWIADGTCTDERAAYGG